MGKIIFVVGGARSGKSKFAMELAKREERDVVYIATAQVRDEEMKLRIRKHLKSRPREWKTIEEPIDLPRAIRKIGGKDRVVIIDCVTLYLSNILLKVYEKEKGCLEGRHKKNGIEKPNDWILKKVRQMVRAISASPHTFILVSNEVGMGIVPENKLARLFRDIQGEANQVISRNADNVYMVTVGIANRIK